jgi:hypothetical protein
MDWKRCTSMVEPNPTIPAGGNHTPTTTSSAGPPTTPPMRAGLADPHGLSEYPRNFPGCL